MAEHEARGETARGSDEAREAELYRRLLELSGSGFLLADPEGRIREADERLCALLGRERRALLGERLSALAGASSGAFEGLGAEGPSARELRLARPDGGEAVLEMRAERAADGSLRAVFRDLAEERHSRERLERKAMFLEAFSESSADGFLVVDPSGRKILQNERTVELWKIPRDVADDPSGDRQVAHVMSFTRNPQCFFEEIEAQKRSPMSVVDDQLELVDGTVLDRHSAPVVGPDGQLYGRVYTFHDVTVFIRAEERIQGLLDEKELILGEVHHRVKNYMSTLISILSLHARTLEEPSAIEALNDAELRMQGMVRLYDKLYVQAGSGTVIASIYMRELVDNILANFPREVELSVEQSYGDFPLDAKTARTLGIIVNELLANIMKYAFVGRDSGRILVSLQALGGAARLDIQDDGVGLPEAKGPGERLGFGRMLVDTLVDQLHGTIEIDRGSGTKYAIAFALA